jgi:uncharacterized protein (TIGR02246 family)
MRRPPPFDTAESVEEAFYDAMQRGDLEAMMGLWSTEDEIFCVHPGGGRLSGHDAIRASWEAIFAGGGLSVEIREITMQDSGVISVHSLVERIMVGAPPDGQLVECAVTNVYVKTAAGWRIMLHHGSPVAEIEAAPPAGAMLH